MLNRGIFTIKVLARITPSSHYHQKIPIRNFLVEIISETNKNKRLRLRLNIPANRLDLSLTQKQEFFLAEGTISTSEAIDPSSTNRKRVFEINADKLHLLS